MLLLSFEEYPKLALNRLLAISMAPTTRSYHHSMDTFVFQFTLMDTLEGKLQTMKTASRLYFVPYTSSSNFDEGGDLRMTMMPTMDLPGKWERLTCISHIVAVATALAKRGESFSL